MGVTGLTFIGLILGMVLTYVPIKLIEKAQENSKIKKSSIIIACTILLFDVLMLVIVIRFII